MPKPLDLSGTRFGIINIISRNGTSNNGKSTWNCKCDCGTEWVAIGANIINGRTKSCGCTNIGNTKHNMSKLNEYNIWCDMKARCYNKTNKSYNLYGGRGITVCNEWKDDFIKFLDDIGSRPSKNYSLERIDVNGNYCNENVIWATQKDQNNNKRNSRKFNYNGEELTVRQIMDKLNTNLPIYVVIHRIDRGWDLELAATKPVKDTTE